MSFLKNLLESKKGKAFLGAVLIIVGSVFSQTMTAKEAVQQIVYLAIAYLTGQSAVDIALAVKGKKKE